MTPIGGKADIHRVVISLDATLESRVALDIGTDLAATMNAELAGLFIEDINLINLARLPFSREVSFGGGRSRVLETSRLEHEIERHAMRCRALVTARAEKAHLTWSFDIRRGERLREIASFCALGDILVFAGDGFVPGAAETLYSAAMDLPTEARAIVITHGARPAADNAPVMLLIEEDQTRPEAMVMAARIAKARNVPLIVMILTSCAEDAKSVKENAKQVIGDDIADIRVSFQQLIACQPAALIDQLEKFQPRFIIADALTGLFRDRRSTGRLIQECHCPFLFLLPEEK